MKEFSIAVGRREKKIESTAIEKRVGCDLVRGGRSRKGKKRKKGKSGHGVPCPYGKRQLGD
jgi:hypothetical protein